MSEEIDRLPSYLREWLANSNLGAYASRYAAQLTDQGYAPRTMDMYLSSVAHFAHWSTGRVGSVAELDEATIVRFLRYLDACRCAPRCAKHRTTSRAALGGLLEWLRAEGLTGRQASARPGPVVRELGKFDRYLTEVRGLQPVTRRARAQHVGGFLDWCHKREVAMTALSSQDIRAFVSTYTAGWKPASVKQVCIALRSYLRFKAVEGIPTAPLMAALPQVAQWRLSSLPRTVSRPEIEQLLRAFDRTTRTSRRDYAVARCYVDLGLRTSEITRLQLDDLDWTGGRILIHSKGRRTDVLPLPATTARAIVAYLRSGRPRSSSRTLFLRHRPPLDKPATADTIRAVIRNAARRCGLAEQLTGTHRLRHSLARQLVQRGTPLKMIADLLRHRSLDTTTIYAKVDLAALSAVAAPWPGGSS